MSCSTCPGEFSSISSSSDDSSPSVSPPTQKEKKIEINSSDLNCLRGVNSNQVGTSHVFIHQVSWGIYSQKLKEQVSYGMYTVIFFKNKKPWWQNANLPLVNCMFLNAEVNCTRLISGLPSLLSGEVITGDFLALLARVCSTCMQRSKPNFKTF